MTDERLFIISYDISDQRRWRRLFKAMHGYGEWIQLSVFQCSLSRRRRAELETRLRELVKNGEDHVLLIDVGPADRIELAMESIGKTFSKIVGQATQSYSMIAEIREPAERSDKVCLDPAACFRAASWRAEGGTCSIRFSPLES